MTIQQLIEEYKKIKVLVDEKWPIENKDQRIFARTMKMVEEMGELSDAILTSMNLQRSEKSEKFKQQDIEDEFADVVGTLILLGVELGINIEESIERKIAFTNNRYKGEE